MWCKINPSYLLNLLSKNPLLMRTVGITLALLGISLSQIGKHAIAASQPLEIEPLHIAQATPGEQPISKAIPLEGMLNVKLTNSTNSKIFYQVVGQTDPRILEEQASLTLQRLKLPTSVLFRRRDNGLLQVTLVPSSDGSVELKFNETKEVDLDKRALTIREDGSLYLR